MTVSAPAAWIRVALVMFAVGWGANQFSPMLIVYRHSLGLGPGEIAGLFAIYAATLIPGLLAGGPLSDRFGRRACVLPFAALSPVATLLLVLGPRSLPLIAAGRALAGLCSGMVFGPATAWVQDLSDGDALSARRAALALSAGFGLGPVVAALLAQWATDPLIVPYLPHLALGTAALAVGLTAPATAGADWTMEPTARPAEPTARRAATAGHHLPAALRGRSFWLDVAPAAPFVFGCASLAIVVLPEEVTSARTLSAGYAGLMTALAFGAGIGVQPAARRLAARRPQAGLAAGLGCAAAGTAVGAAAVSRPEPAARRARRCATRPRVRALPGQRPAAGRGARRAGRPRHRARRLLRSRLPWLRGPLRGERAEPGARQAGHVRRGGRDGGGPRRADLAARRPRARGPERAAREHAAGKPRHPAPSCHY